MFYNFIHLRLSKIPPTGPPSPPPSLAKWLKMQILRLLQTVDWLAQPISICWEESTDMISIREEVPLKTGYLKVLVELLYIVAARSR